MPKPRVAVVLLGALLLLLDTALLVRVPVVGITDNGDSWRVMNPAGLSYFVPYLDGRTMSAFPGGHSPRRSYVEQRFRKGEPKLASLPSSPALVAWAARGLDPSPSSAGVMDLRQIGVAYVLLLVAAATLLVGAKPVPLVAGLLMLWVVSDPMYLFFFNSFYADAAMFVGMFGITAWLLRHDGEPAASGAPRALSLLSVLFFACLGAFSKASYAPLALVAVPAVWWASRNARAPGRGGARATALSIAVVAVLAIAHFSWGSGFRAPRINRYNSVFVGIARASQDPRGTLVALGIPPERRALIGRAYFDDRLSEEERGVAADVSPARVALRYLADPGATVRAVARVAGALARERKLREPGSESSGGSEPFERAPWHFGLVRRWLLGWPWQVGVWTVVCFAFVGRRLAQRKWDALATAVAFLLGLFAVEVVVSVLGDGFFALVRHLLAARLALDSCVVIVSFVAVRSAICAIASGSGAPAGRAAPAERERPS